MISSAHGSRIDPRLVEFGPLKESRANMRGSRAWTFVVLGTHKLGFGVPDRRRGTGDRVSRAT